PQPPDTEGAIREMQSRRTQLAGTLAIALTIAIAAGASPMSPVSATTHSPSDSTPAASATAAPKPLLTIESKAEDIIDVVVSRNWTRINHDTTAIKSAWKRYEPRATDDGVSTSLLGDFTSALDELTATAKSKDAPGTA